MEEAQITTKIPLKLKRRMEQYALRIDDPSGKRMALKEVVAEAIEEYLNKRERKK